MKNLVKELQEFDHERFNEHYRNLIDVAITSSREDEVLQALSFLDSCQTFIDNVKEKLEKQPAETHCPVCKEKEKIIKIMEERIKTKDDSIDILKRLKDAAMKELNSINGEQLKVCK